MKIGIFIVAMFIPLVNHAQNQNSLMARVITLPGEGPGSTGCTIFLDKDGITPGPSYSTMLALLKKKPQTKSLLAKYLNLKSGQEVEIAIPQMAFNHDLGAKGSPGPGEINMECKIVESLAAELNSIIYTQNPAYEPISFSGECFGEIDLHACEQRIKSKGGKKAETDKDKAVK